MGTEIILLAISLAVTAASTAAQASAAQSEAKARRQAAEANNLLQQNEFTRQQAELDRIANEEKSDVIQKAEGRLGTLQASVGELGTSTSTVARLVAEIGGFEGLDLSRVEANRKADIAALQARKVSAGQDFSNIAASSALAAKNAQTAALLGGVGSALQIGVSFQGRRAQTKRATAAAAAAQERAR